MSHNYSFVVLKHLFWNELTFLVTYDVIMINISPEAAVRRCSLCELCNNKRHSHSCTRSYKAN